MTEKYYEELLNINTTGEQSWDEVKKFYHPYEPTPYFALDEFFKNLFRKNISHIIFYNF